MKYDLNSFLLIGTFHEDNGRGGGKGYLCLRHKLCFPNPNSAAANEEFLQNQFFTRHLVAINKIYKTDQRRISLHKFNTI